MRYILSLILSLLFLAACTTKQSFPPPSAVSPEDVGSPAAAMPVPGEEGVMEKQVFGEYAPFVDDVIGDGTVSVLYFKADWCPYCVKQHAAFQEEYDFPLSTYYLDYDTATELRSRYGVVSQHTFVKIDGAGNKIGSLTFPGNADLAEFLQE